MSERNTCSDPDSNRISFLKCKQAGALQSKRSRDKSVSSSSKDCLSVDSKEHLSEMAFNIRGISNALNNIAVDLTIKNLIIITKLSDNALPGKLRKLTEWLLNLKSQDEEGLNVYVEDVMKPNPSFGYESIVKAKTIESNQLRFWDLDLLRSQPRLFDLAITLGGDGTVLYTSWLFQQTAPPVLSFSLGSLGFMTENSFDDFQEIISSHIKKGITCALRMRFECTVMRSRNPDQTGQDDLKREIEAGDHDNCYSTHRPDNQFVILNDIVVDRGPNPVITMTELYGNFQLLTSVYADGVVISTPSGSTAYSMSAGGSLVHPDVPAMLVTPICPHSLSFRPLVLPDSMTVHIGVPYDARSSVYASFDGKGRFELCRGDFLCINASRYAFPKVLKENFSNGNWVQTLSKTLHWNEQKRPKRLE